MQTPLSAHLMEADILGADTDTVWWLVLQKMVKNPLTDIGLERLLADRERVEK